MIRKFKTIDEFAVFKAFDWDSSVKDKENKIAEFKKLNILYGRNYSGKTTLSRIFRSLEKGCRHEKYPSACYELDHSGTERLCHESLNTCPYEVRVYNKDFVSENLRWLIDEEGCIKSFAILGEKNIEIEKQIAAKEKNIGSEEEKTGFRYELKIKEDEHLVKQKEKERAQNMLDEKLRIKANEIKRNLTYNEITYNITKINADIKNIKNKPRLPLKPNEIEEKTTLLKEQTKDLIKPSSGFVPSFQTIYDKSEKLLSRDIRPTESIQDLLNDALLQEWVRAGVGHHKEKRKNCAFCGGELHPDLWKKLDAHFSKESEVLRIEIKEQINFIKREKEKISSVFNLEKTKFYSAFHAQFDEIKNEWEHNVTQYCTSLDSIIVDLENREKDIFKKRNLTSLLDNSNAFKDLQTRLNDLIKDSNNKAKTLATDQSLAREDLRLDAVSKFIKDIGYDNEQTKIKQFAIKEGELRVYKEGLAERIKIEESEIKILKAQMQDEEKGAKKINEYLNHYFGHRGLELVPVKQENSAVFNFQIMRGENIAHNLSEGECSLVAFCYFMAKLDDIDTRNKELIIWIDDPVSSLDNNHIFFVFSLIENVIAKPVKNKDGAKSYKYKQLFISTHNLEFLKYLKRITTPTGKDNTIYFLVERNDIDSQISLMPDYLKNYITEFNYLFHQIYKCKNGKNAKVDHSSFYNFGNNLRKFLEAYLFYKYPDNMGIDEKLLSFFGDDQTSVDLANRIENEMSHLYEVFDRSMRPIEIPEIPKVATYVLDKMKKKDEEQYMALLNSIGETDL